MKVGCSIIKGFKSKKLENLKLFAFANMEHALSFFKCKEHEINEYLGVGFSLEARTIQNIRLSGGVGSANIENWHPLLSSFYESRLHESSNLSPTTLAAIHSLHETMCKYYPNKQECTQNMQEPPHRGCLFCEKCSNVSNCFTDPKPTHLPQSCNILKATISKMDELPLFFLDFLKPVDYFYSEKRGCKIKLQENEVERQGTLDLICLTLKFFKLGVGEQPDIGYWKLILEYFPFFYEHSDILLLLNKLNALNDLTSKELSERLSSFTVSKTIQDIEQSKIDMRHLENLRKRLSSLRRSRAKSLYTQKEFTNIPIIYLIVLTTTIINSYWALFRIRPVDLNLIYKIEVFLSPQEKSKFLEIIDERFSMLDLRRLPRP